MLTAAAIAALCLMNGTRQTHASERSGWSREHGQCDAPAIDRAARLAEGWITSPSLTYAEARTQADLYRERCAAYGNDPGAIVLRRDIYVGESSTEVQAVLQHALSRGYRGMPAEALIAGTVDEVVQQFRESSLRSATATFSCAI
jgi:alkanesulfonate monooxygenase SsuD/methylene tetrahydromethanopterin reductase-like flavin-dependent oxidoreductase (luciferase family)